MDEWMPKNPVLTSVVEGKRWQMNWTIHRLENKGLLTEQQAKRLRGHVEAGDFDGR